MKLVPPDADHRSRFPLFLITTLLLSALGIGTATAADPPAGPSEQAAQGLIEQAQTLIESRQYDAAIAALKNFLAAYPQSSHVDKAYLLLGAALNGNKKPAEAIAFLDQLMTEYPKSPLVGRARLLTATAHADMGNPDQALAILAETRSLESSSDIKRDALKLSGEILITKGDYPHAIQSWLDELNLAPESERDDVRARITSLVRDKMDRKALLRLRDSYPTTFPGDVALIRMIELHTARGEEHLAERNLRIFLNRFPNHAYAKTATEALRAFKGKLQGSQYVIAVVLPTSGRASQFGSEVLNGIRLALEKGRETMGLTSVGLIVKDSETDQSLLRFELSDMISEYHPLAVIGPIYSRDVPLAAELAEKTETPFVTPTATLSDVRRLSSYMFNTAVSFSQQAKRLASYAINYLGYNRFAVLYPDSSYGQEMTRQFVQEVRRMGKEIIAVDSYKETDTDFGTQIRRIKTEDLKRHGKSKAVPMSKGGTRIEYRPGFDAVFLPGAPAQVGLITSQLLFHDVKVGFLGTSAWNTPELLRLADKTIEGDVFVDGFFADSTDPNVHDFVVRYRLRHQADPTSFAAQAYDATRLVLEAIKRGATTGRAIRDLLSTAPDLPVLGGPAAFGPDGTLNRHIAVIEIKKGKFVQID